jgi:hypothetical protein
LENLQETPEEYLGLKTGWCPASFFPSTQPVDRIHGIMMDLVYISRPGFLLHPHDLLGIHRL